MKMDTISALLRREAMQIEVAQSIRIAGRICNQRSKTALLREIQESLPDFFGFKEVGLMFRDVKTNMLFTINLLSKDEQEEWIKSKLKEQGNTVTSKQQQQQMEILFDQFQETFNIAFPNHLGITGKAFHQEQIFISNNPKSDKLFTNEIDNQTCEDNVRNFMIGPVYGHLRDSVTDNQACIDFDEDLSECEEANEDDEQSSQSDRPKKKAAAKKKLKIHNIQVDRSKPLGILQFINTTNGR